MCGSAMHQAIVQLTRVHGIGPVNARSLFHEGITTITNLREAYQAGRIGLAHEQIVGLKHLEVGLFVRLISTVHNTSSSSRTALRMQSY